MFATQDKIKKPKPTLYEYMQQIGKIDRGEEARFALPPNKKNIIPDNPEKRNFFVSEDHDKGFSIQELMDKYSLDRQEIISILYGTQEKEN